MKVFVDGNDQGGMWITTNAFLTSIGRCLPDGEIQRAEFIQNTGKLAAVLVGLWKPVDDQDSGFGEDGRCDHGREQIYVFVVDLQDVWFFRHDGI